MGDESKSGERMPPLALASAGLAVFDAFMAVSFLAFWSIDGRSALAMIQALTGLAILLSLGAITVGSLVLVSNKRHSIVTPGTGWANASVVAGLLLLGLTVALPLISALQVLVGGDQ
jgi:hypothetical protein